MKSLFSKVLLVLVGLAAFLCCSCEKPQEEYVDSRVIEEPPVIDELPVILEPAPEDPNIVAVIENFNITKKELESKLLDETSPRSFPRIKSPEDIDVQKVLLNIVAEKAMAIEGRKLGYLADAGIQRQMNRFREKLFFNMVVDNYIKDKEVEVTQEEVERKLKGNPRLDAERARAMLHNEKTSILVDSLYQELIKKLNLRKLDENLAKAVTIYQKLLDNSTNPVMKFVTRKQIQNDLTQGEKQLVLAVYEGGEVTLEEWFETLSRYSPPKRPKGLNTPAGFEKFMDQAILKKSIIVAGAYALGLDKMPEFLEPVKSREDFFLIRKVILEKKGRMDETTDKEIVAYFNQHKEDFMSPPDRLKIDQLWCPDVRIVALVKKELDKGASFKDLKQRYSFTKQAEPVTVTAKTEGIFFEQLWTHEPNDIVGPVSGFYRRSIGPRFVKILEKTPGEQIEYSQQLDEDIKRGIYAELSEKRLSEYRKELLEKYQYGICPDRFAYLVDFYKYFK